MIGIKDLRHRPEDVINVLERRGGGYRQAVDGILELDRRCRQLKNDAEQLRVQQKAISARAGKLRKAEDDGSPALQTLRQEAVELRKRQDEISEGLGQAEDQLEAALLQLPNLLADSVPDGKNSNENVVMQTTGGPREFQFSPKAHFELGEELGILDLERGTRLTGSGFYVLRDQGARLKRALVNFMLDLHTREHGYTEIQTPNLANATTMRGTGQLPKFAEDMYQVDDGLFAIPTAEVTLTNLHAGEILREGDLPKHYTAETRCYRKERGNYGKDTRGMLRVHEFRKVELVKIVTPETSPEEHERLTRDAEHVLQLLELPHRRILLCSGDTGFSAAKTYDLEVWMPSLDRWVEISSCSNCTAFQARRMQTRYRNQRGEVDFVHTLNGSGVAVGRAFAAVLENFQEQDGSVVIPDALRPYFGDSRISRKDLIEVKSSNTRAATVVSAV